MSLSPQAYIHPDTSIGENVTIGPFTTIEKGVIVGNDTWIGPNVTIFQNTKIGNSCKIFPGAVLGAIPQDLKFDGENTNIEIGDNTTIRECVTVNRGTKDKYKTVIGSDCLLMAYVHVAHDCEVGNNCILANCVNLAGHVIIEDYAILEALVAVQQFLKVGEHAFVAGASLVRKNVPPFVKAAREPISYVGVNSIGLKRRLFEEDVIRSIEDIYREIYVLNSNITKALSIVEEKFENTPQRRKITDFIRQSEKGVMRGSTS